MAGVSIQGNISGNVAEVDSNNNVFTLLPVAANNSGYEAIAAVVSDGTVSPRLVRKIHTGQTNRLRSAVDSIQMSERFTGTTINTGVWFQSTSTSTITVASGFCNLNASQLLASGNGAAIHSYRSFPLYMDGSLRMDFTFSMNILPILGNQIEMGLGVGVTATTSPTDGVFIRFNASGEWVGVISAGQTTPGAAEIQIDLGGFTPNAGQLYDCTIVATPNAAYFYIGGILYATISATLLTGSGICNNFEQQAFFRYTNNIAVGTAPKLSIGNVNVTSWDLGAAREWRHAKVGNYESGIQTQTGFTSTHGSLANFALSAAPSTATLSNTAASYTTLGGQAQWAAVNSSEQSNCLFAYQVPSGTAAMPGKSFFITAIRIDMSVLGATSAQSTCEWAIAVGSTAASLATTEGAGTKAPRVLPLGYTSIPVIAVNLGGMATYPIETVFQCPLVANQGEYIQVIMKNVVGTNTASVILRATVAINGYFE